MSSPSRFPTNPLLKKDPSKLPPLEAKLLPEENTIDRGLWWRGGRRV